MFHGGYDALGGYNARAALFGSSALTVPIEDSIKLTKANVDTNDPLRSLGFSVFGSGILIVRTNSYRNLSPVRVLSTLPFCI